MQTEQADGAVETTEADASEGAEPAALPRPDAHLLLWRAGRARLVGVPDAWAEGREKMRAAAVAELTRELGPESSTREAWVSHLTFLLTDPETEGDLWCASARVVGTLGRYELAPALLAALGKDAPPRRREAAARGLHALYGRWFTTPEEAGPYVAGVRPGAGTRLLLESALARELEADASLVRALGYEPATAASYLTSSDPALRAGAARVLGEAVAAGALPRDAALAALFPRLESEQDAAAFDAALGVTLDLLAGAAPEATEVVRLRDILEKLARETPDGRSLSVARGLARLPLAMEPPPGTPGALSAVAWIGWILDAQREAEARHGAPDPDSILACLEALRVLCDRVEGERPRQELHRNDARVPIFEILQDSTRSLDERVAAVGLLRHFALEEDADLIDTVLGESGAEPTLSHALLGALRAILPRFRAGEAETTALLSTVARLTGSDDPDLRRRALALLGDEKLAEHVAGLDPLFLVERLGEEEIPDLQSAILRLIERFGGPALLTPMLQLEDFDRLATGDLERLSRLTRALGELAGDRPLYRMAVARRLVAVADDASRLSRLQRALTLVFALDPAAAAQLGPADNDQVGAWAWELHAAGLSLDSLTDGPALRKRMVEVHLAPRPTEAEPEGAAPLFPEAKRQHLLGVYLGKMATATDPPADPEPAEAAFARALELADPATDPQLAALVRRDRARFRGSRGARGPGLADYRALLGTGVLELSDLRQAVGWIAALAGTEPASAEAAAQERYDLLDRLVHRTSWRSEPAAVRLEDLRQLAASAHACPAAVREDRLRRFAALFADLPATRPENGHDVENAPLWHGLPRDDASFAELVSLRDAALAALTPPPKEAPADSPPAGTPPPDPESGSGSGGGDGSDGGADAGADGGAIPSPLPPPRS